MVGLQGGEQPPTEYLPTPNASVGAEAKHCCAYGFSGLDGGAADLSEKTLHDIYLKPWRAFVRKGGSGVMMSHNEINGMPMHANADFMKHLFRETWNYTGFFHSVEHKQSGSSVACDVVDLFAESLLVMTGLWQCRLAPEQPHRW